jgi:outer membrane protein
MNHANLLAFTVGVAAVLAGGGAAAQDRPHSVTIGGAFIDIDSRSPPLAGGPALPPPGAVLRVDDARTVLFSYAYRWRPAWSVEAALGVPPRHRIYGDGVIEPFGQVASVKQIAPTAFVNYHFGPFGGIEPFVGAGINYTRFDSARVTAAGELATGGPTKIDVGDSWGWALHAGAKVALRDRLSLVASVAHADVKSDVKLTTSTAGGNVVRTTRIDYRPVVYALSLGYAF